MFYSAKLFFLFFIVIVGVFSQQYYQPPPNYQQQQPPNYQQQPNYQPPPHNYQANYEIPADAVLLENVQALTFEAGRMTTGRRSAPMLELMRVGGVPHPLGELQRVQCTNVGKNSNGEVQWRCEADLDSRVRFGRADVSCEGYSSPTDPYVLRGSCALEYSLESTGGSSARGGYYGQGYSYHDNSSGWGAFVFVIILVFVIGFCAFGASRKSTTTIYSTGPYATGSYPYHHHHTTVWSTPSYSSYHTHTSAPTAPTTRTSTTYSSTKKR